MALRLFHNHTCPYVSTGVLYKYHDAYRNDQINLTTTPVLQLLTRVNNCLHLLALDINSSPPRMAPARRAREMPLRHGAACLECRGAGILVLGARHHSAADLGIATSWTVQGVVLEYSVR
jgi:hypothetical protein